ncbi:FAD-dependent monooxygenase [Actinocrispum wychmicini]|uniref:2-polyprenyl-6-methoxyphenol hydroxylase-like FAD-dependent oxidoreductase n=1 Tax=Actinocrispum wychmicini TaxID=1213861 RepID=A0A4R2JQS7_9PSEU|nr:FAD-dependent monooxygenase [Actinocrispum wychmicini]TCO62591.1 2-polyprenyl-6-methoxyphenol hydroxylase-like FAD-dependent oxidoreductase [Actinocrispum wychmicini]
MRVLISGASISGPVLAYWLTKYGFEVTVVERSPVLRKTGGHAVDLFRPAMEISERMGVVATIERAATHVDHAMLYREGSDRPVRADFGKLFAATSDRHVEILRDDLSEIYYDATRDDVEYLFGDSITSIDDGAVTFENGPRRQFDIVVGADGLHSNVRSLVFGEESAHSSFIGAYLAVATVPKDICVSGEYKMRMTAGRMTGVYSTAAMPDGRLVFLLRGRPMRYHHRDVEWQKQFLRETYQGMHHEVDAWLSELDSTPAFYFDSITQLRMDTWSRGRVTLVGDAGYCPGPAVGGSTSLAVIGAYVLAGELAAAQGDHTVAFPAYEREMADLVRQSREFARKAAKGLIPGSAAGVWTLLQAARLITALPVGVSRLVSKLTSGTTRMHDSMTVKPYADLQATESGSAKPQARS